MSPEAPVRLGSITTRFLSIVTLSCSPFNFSKFDKRIRLVYRFNNLFAVFIHMRSGKDGEYYYAELSKDEVIKLKEIVEKKAKLFLGSPSPP